MSFNKKTILIVDANKTFVLYMSIMLKRMGFNVLTANTGLEALVLVRQVMPDLLVLDSTLPSSEGYDTLSRLKADESTNELPVIMMMGQEDDSFVRRCREAGCNGFLPKPIPMDLLHEYIQDFIFSPLGFRRKHLRVQAEVKVMLLCDGAAREYRTETVSEGGAYLKTAAPFKVGTKVEVSLPYKSASLDLQGVVIYNKTGQDDKTTIPAGMAIEFKDISARDTLVLSRLVSELIAGDIPEVNGKKMLTMPWRDRVAGSVPSRKDA